MNRNDSATGWIWKGIAIAAVLIGAGCLAFFIWTENRAERKRQETSDAMEQELRPLEVERHKLRQELDKIQTKYKRESQGTGNLVLLFTNLDEQIYTEIFPQMEECGFKGVLALSEECHPGAPGCMSRKQFRELTDAGWECCLRWEEDAEAEDWAAEGGRLARAAGISVPEAVYFKVDAYDSEKDSFLLKKNLSTIVHHGEGDLPLITFEVGEGIWQVGAMPWGQADAQAMVGEAIEQKGSLIFTIGDDSAEEEYDSDRYLSMLEYLYSCCKSDDLKVMTLTQARDYRQNLSEGKEGLTETYNEQKADLEAQLEELERKIDEITDRYGQNGQ